MSHIYLMHENDSITDLTPGENEKASFRGWSSDNKSMYYISKKIGHNEYEAIGIIHNKNKNALTKFLNA